MFHTSFFLLTDTIILMCSLIENSPLFVNGFYVSKPIDHICKIMRPNYWAALNNNLMPLILIINFCFSVNAFLDHLIKKAASLIINLKIKM